MKKIIIQSFTCVIIFIIGVIFANTGNESLNKCVTYVNSKISAHYTLQDVKEAAKVGIATFNKATETFANIVREDGK